MLSKLRDFNFSTLIPGLAYPDAARQQQQAPAAREGVLPPSPKARGRQLHLRPRPGVQRRTQGNLPLCNVRIRAGAIPIYGNQFQIPTDSDSHILGIGPSPGLHQKGMFGEGRREPRLG